MSENEGKAVDDKSTIDIAEEELQMVHFGVTGLEIAENGIIRI